MKKVTKNNKYQPNKVNKQVLIAVDKPKDLEPLTT